MPNKVIFAILLALLIPIPAFAQDINSQLIEAAKNGQTEKVRALLKGGADVNAKNKVKGTTGLIYAVVAGHTDTVKILLDAGADVNAKNEDGLTATMAAALTGQYSADASVRSAATEIIELLKKAGHVTRGGYDYRPDLMQRKIPPPVDLSSVVVEYSQPAYTVYLGVPSDTAAKKLGVGRIFEDRRRATQQKDVELVSWKEFRENTGKYIDSRMVTNEYSDSKVAEGITEFLRRYPGVPIGLTWNGGISFTANDYEHAKRTHSQYLADPAEYASTKTKDPRADPVKPKWHFGPLLGWK